MRTRLASTVIALAAIAATVVSPGGARASGYLTLVGAIHEHSGYSDGWPGSRPANYFASGKAHGLDFLFGGEHSDNGPIPVAFSSECTDDPTVAATCTTADDDKVSQVLKWQAQLDQANAASVPDQFTAGRGFEWTSDVFGHINVYLSTNDENAKTDGGYGVTMETFWSWFTRPTSLGGGDDGIATFNHPGDKCRLGRTDPTCDWNQFAYVPAADARMVGVELFNSKDYGEYYVQALDNGWHVGAVGAEDLGHDRSDDWGAPQHPKTVVLATSRTATDLRAAMLARRTYAIEHEGIRLDFRVNGALMGSRLSIAPGDGVVIDASANDPSLTLEVVTSGGIPVASGTGSIHTTVPSAGSQRYYFLRVSSGGAHVAYSSPVWVTAS
jgi:hypothetical protein